MPKADWNPSAQLSHRDSTSPSLTQAQHQTLAAWRPVFSQYKVKRQNLMLPTDRVWQPGVSKVWSLQHLPCQAQN